MIIFLSILGHKIGVPKSPVSRSRASDSVNTVRFPIQVIQVVRPLNSQMISDVPLHPTAMLDSFPNAVRSSKVSSSNLGLLTTMALEAKQKSRESKKHLFIRVLSTSYLFVAIGVWSQS